MNLGSLEEPGWWRSRWHAVAVLISLAGAGLLVHFWAADRPMWLDEEMIALNLRDRSLAHLAGSLWLGQTAPLGWLALQRVALLLLGTGERAMRLVPLLFGLATPAVAIWIGRRWMGPVGAAALTLLCSLGQWTTFYSLELKHYSADVSLALLLPALAVWVVEAESREATSLTRRAAVWWGVAAVAHWFGNGALLVTPGCSLFLLVMLWLRAGPRAALVFASLGLGWLASFSLHYALALRPALGSDQLRTYWQFALPPRSAGLGGTLLWLGSQLQSLAAKPGGASLWRLFWVTALSGLFFGSRPRLGLAFATVPLSACVLAGLRIVPVHERLSLWVVPALYAGVALLVDRAALVGWRAHACRKAAAFNLALVVGLVGFIVCHDIYWNGVEDPQVIPPFDSNHRLNDREAVQWLMANRQPGDVLMASHLALPAVWWYGAIPITDASEAGSRQSDGSPVLEVGYQEPGPRCRQDQLRDALKDGRRVLVYFGFREDTPQGFDDLILARLSELGAIAADRKFGPRSRGTVVELRPPIGVSQALTNPPGTAPLGTPVWLKGCLSVRPARRW